MQGGLSKIQTNKIRGTADHLFLVSERNLLITTESTIQLEEGIVGEWSGKGVFATCNPMSARDQFLDIAAFHRLRLRDCFLVCAFNTGRRRRSGIDEQAGLQDCTSTHSCSSSCWTAPS